MLFKKGNIKQLILGSILIAFIWLIMALFDWYPSHVYYRYKLSKFMASGEQEIYMRDLVSFKFKDVYFIYSYDDLIYDKRCGLKNTVSPDDGLWGIAYVMENCDSFEVMLDRSFPYGRSNRNDDGTGIRQLGYNEAKIKLTHNKPGMEYPYCYGNKEPCLVLDY